MVDAHDEAQLDNKEQATCNHNMDSGQQAEMGRQKKKLWSNRSCHLKTDDHSHQNHHTWIFTQKALDFPHIKQVVL